MKEQKIMEDIIKHIVTYLDIYIFLLREDRTVQDLKDYLQKTRGHTSTYRFLSNIDEGKAGALLRDGERVFVDMDTVLVSISDFIGVLGIELNSYEIDIKELVNEMMILEEKLNQIGEEKDFLKYRLSQCTKYITNLRNQRIIFKDILDVVAPTDFDGDMLLEEELDHTGEEVNF